MGLFKQEYIECQDRGYGHSDKYVSAECFPDDDYLKEYIRENGTVGYCDFTEKNDEKVVPLEDLMSIIMKAVNIYYVKADGNVTWDSEEGYYDGHVIDRNDIAYDILGGTGCDDKIISEITKLMNDDLFTPESQFITTVYEESNKLWNEYCNDVFKCDISSEQIVKLCIELKNGEDFENKVIADIADCLEMVILYIEKFNMTDTIFAPTGKSKGTKLYRCVNYLADKDFQFPLTYFPAMSIGSAPSKSTNAGRMNEKGDMIFYGSFSKAVARIEVGSNSKHPEYPITEGCFVTNKDFKIVDLSKIDCTRCPSIFDIKHKDDRETWLFLRNFTNEISKPVNDEKNYKPTQVLSKYIQRNTCYKGLEYRSAHKEGTGKKENNNVSLFIDHKDCLDRWEKPDADADQLIMISNAVQKPSKPLESL